MRSAARGRGRSEFYELFAAAARSRSPRRRRPRRASATIRPASTQAEIKELEHEGDRIIGELIGADQHAVHHAVRPRRPVPLAARSTTSSTRSRTRPSCSGSTTSSSRPRQSLEQCGSLVAATEQLEALLRNLKGKARLVARDRRDQAARGRGRHCPRRAGRPVRGRAIDPLIVIRWKDIYEALEEAIDAVETAAHRIGNILVKNAVSAYAGCDASVNSRNSRGDQVGRLLADVDGVVADPLEAAGDDQHPQAPLALVGVVAERDHLLDRAAVRAVDQLVELDERLAPARRRAAANESSATRIISSARAPISSSASISSCSPRRPSRVSFVSFAIVTQ